jgi:hypothetical protein
MFAPPPTSIVPPLDAVVAAIFDIVVVANVAKVANESSLP